MQPGQHTCLRRPREAANATARRRGRPDNRRSAVRGKRTGAGYQHELEEPGARQRRGGTAEIASAGITAGLATPLAGDGMGGGMSVTVVLRSMKAQKTRR